MVLQQLRGDTVKNSKIKTDRGGGAGTLHIIIRWWYNNMGGDTVQNSKTKTDREGGGHGDTANNQNRVI